MALTLSERLGRIEKRLAQLKDKFPRWKLWGSNYGPGNTLPDYYHEIRQLEKEREELILRLAKKGEEADALESKGKKQDPSRDEPFTHSEDYRSVTVRGETHRLTSQQAAMIQILREAYNSGNADVSIAHVLEQLEAKDSRWQDTFKSNRDARKALITSGTRKGTLRLNL